MRSTHTTGYGSRNGGQAFNTKFWKEERKSGTLRCGDTAIFKAYRSPNQISNEKSGFGNYSSAMRKVTKKQLSVNINKLKKGFFLFDELIS